MAETYDANGNLITPEQGFLDALGNLSTFGGSTAGNMAKGLIEQTKLNQEQDKLGLARTNTGVNVGNLDLAQKKLALAAPNDLAGTSVRGDVLANGQDASFSGLNPKIHIPTMTGGLRPSLFSDSTRALGAQMSRQALTDGISGKYTTMRDLPSVPPATAMPDPSVLQGFLAKTGIAAGLGSTAGGLLAALKKLIDDAKAKGGGASGGGGGGSNGGSGGGGGYSGPGGNTPITPGYFDPDGNWIPGPDPNETLNSGGLPGAGTDLPPIFPVANVDTSYDFLNDPNLGNWPDDPPLFSY